MTTAIIGTGGIGSAIARLLAAGGETLRLSSADNESTRTLAAEIGPAAVAAAGNRDALQGAGAVILALRAFGTMSAGLLESSSNRSPGPAVLFYATDDDRAAEEIQRLIRTAGFEPEKVGGIEQSGRLQVGGDLHDLVVGPAEARTLISGT